MSKRKPYYKHAAETYEKARTLRREGLGYRSISNEVGVSWSVVRSWVKDIEVCHVQAHLVAMKKRRKSLNALKNKGSIRTRLLTVRGKQCETCKIQDWFDMPLSFEIDHIDGDNKNNKEENLRILCPNCHSQTPTFRRRKTPK